MSAIRVLHVLNGFYMDGLEALLMNIYRNIDREKVQFDFIIHTDSKGASEEEILKMGGNIYKMPKYKIMNHFKYTNEWENLFEADKDYKIIHSHIGAKSYPFFKIAKKGGLFTILHSHTISVSKGLTLLARRILQKKLVKITDYRIACSTPAGEVLHGNNDFEIFKNAIKVEKFLFSQSVRNEVRNELKLDNKFVIGHVGRFDYVKNHEFIIDVFYEVKKRKSNAFLVLVGMGLEKDVKPIADKVEALGLSDNVAFLGARADVNRLYQGMDLLLFPSRFEGLGMAIIEAQTASLPCVVSDAIPSEVKITDLVEFIPLDKGAEYWSEKVLNHADENSRKDIQENIVKEIRESGYDIKELARKYKDFYLDIINKN